MRKPTGFHLFNWKIILLLCLTIGLAPYTPEPHIWGKLKWVMGGANGMAAMDWLDLFFHGIPWCLLIAKSIFYIIKLKRN
ncbi:MAG: hypothetical protein IPM92_03195 [Saprospiraceae bacterium]|nr:hypothetical protein [Saprospiraceae bacterium]